MKCLQNRYAETEANLARPLRALGAMIVVLLMSFSVWIPAALAQDPPQYQLTWLGDGRPRDINEAGVVVSNYGPGIFDTDTGSRSLNDLDGDWFDLDRNVGSQQTFEWIASSAPSINEGGQIVGTASHEPGVEADRVFVLNDPLGPAPEFFLLPRFGGAGNNGFAINDYGVVVGNGAGEVIVFDPNAGTPYSPVGISVPENIEPQEINNDGIIAARTPPVVNNGYVISPNPVGSYTGAIVDYFPGDELYGINDAGMISGRRNPITGGRPSQRLDGGAFRFQFPGVPVPADLLIIDNGSGAAFCDVNNLGDVAFTYNGRGFLAKDRGVDPPETFGLDQLVVNQDADWLNSNIQPTGITDNGKIIGQTNVGGVWKGFLLTPIVPGAGISVTPTSGLVTTETGGQDSFDVVLDTEPTADVTTGISSSNTGEGLLEDPDNPSGPLLDSYTLTFDATNWNQPRTVTVVGVDDAIEDGEVAYKIITAAATSTDPEYDGLDADDVSVTNEDDDSTGGGSETYSADDIPQSGLAIPDNNSGVATSNILASDHLITGLTVNVNISHPRPSDLEVYLIGPDGGPPVRLFIFSGDNNVADFNGTNSLGQSPLPWTLEVYDTRKKKTGTLNSWSMTVDY